MKSQDFDDILNFAFVFQWRVLQPSRTKHLLTNKYIKLLSIFLILRSQ